MSACLSLGPGRGWDMMHVMAIKDERELEKVEARREICVVCNTY